MEISIHLMLMLITKAEYTSCSEKNFNTSHVNVNHQNRDFILCFKNISIHLMLMLILYNKCEWFRDGDFTTSHVNVNLETTSNITLTVFISIHLMLMLIPNEFKPFQSCLNLSLPILVHFPQKYQPINLFITTRQISL